jgi:transcriptional regulator with XRE-family HTH domain
MKINAKYLGFIEQGKANPTLEMLTHLARTLKVELVDLFNYVWFRTNETELRRQIKAMAERADLPTLREMLALMKARDV